MQITEKTLTVVDKAEGIAQIFVMATLVISLPLFAFDMVMFLSHMDDPPNAPSRPSIHLSSKPCPLLRPTGQH
jgi:hypothetical protein